MFKRTSWSFLIFLLWVLVQAYGQLRLSRAVIDGMTTREMRHYHYLWHQVRNLWDRFDLNTQRELTRLGWAPPRPAQRYVNGQSIPLEDNDSGEDFLYMHRQMIATVNSILLVQERPSRLGTWARIPSPTSIAYPLPPAYNAGNRALTDMVQEFKTDEFHYRYVEPREAQLKDPSYLRTLTLGQLGSKLEFTIHNWLHVRWSGSSSMGYRSRSVSDPLPDINEIWDNRNYDWLIDSYASPVNPYFWMIHAWVDDRIEDWRRANNLTEIVWKGTWTGGPMSRADDLIEAGNNVNVRNLMEMDMGPGNGDMDNDASDGKNRINVLEEVTKVVLKTGLESHFYDKIVLNEELPAPKKSKCKKRRL